MILKMSIYHLSIVCVVEIVCGFSLSKILSHSQVMSAMLLNVESYNLCLFQSGEVLYYSYVHLKELVSKILDLENARMMNS